MARRRKAKTKTITRFVKKAGRRIKRASSNPTAVIIPAMAYGALRAKMAQLIAPVTDKIPFGNYADELGMGLVSYFAAKKGIGIVKKLGIAGLTIESAQVGQQLMAGGFNLGNSSQTATTIYG